jgi:transcriptional regulator with XRE-family HTH domain
MGRAAGLGPFVRQLRLSRGATVEALAASAHISSSYLFRIERGEAPNPSLSLLRKLAAALDVSVETLTQAGRNAPTTGRASLADEIAAILHTLPEDDLELVREVVRLLQRRSRRRRS